MRRTSIGIAALALGLAGPANAADVKVTVDGIHPGAGAIRVALYAGPDGFRHEPDAKQVLSAPANAATAMVDFKDVPAGRYAVIAYHDENDNKKMDLILGMLPDEGWGLSNDPRVMGPPRFEPSAFQVAEPGAATEIHLHY